MLASASDDRRTQSSKSIITTLSTVPHSATYYRVRWRILSVRSIGDSNDSGKIYRSVAAKRLSFLEDEKAGCEPGGEKVGRPLPSKSSKFESRPCGGVVFTFQALADGALTATEIIAVVGSFPLIVGAISRVTSNC